MSNDNIANFCTNDEVDMMINKSSHTRAVSCDDEDFLLIDDFMSNSQEITFTKQRQPSYTHHGAESRRRRFFEQERLLIDASEFDTMEIEETPVFDSGLREWLPHEIPYNTAPVNQHMFDPDDVIRIPSFDGNTRWADRSSDISISSIGKESLAKAVNSGEEQIQSAQLTMLEEIKTITKQQQNSKTEKQKDLIAESEISSRDVICERGGKSNRHDGTKKYRGVVEKYKPIYQDLPTKSEKTNLSRKIIKMIQSHGGRFLKKDDETGRYFVLSPVETTKKVSQALREKKALKWVRDGSV